MLMQSSSPLHYVDLFFFFTDTATTEIYTLSLHDALPISDGARVAGSVGPSAPPARARARGVRVRALVTGVAGFIGSHLDRKSTRLNSSHPSISYAVFCLKKKKNKHTECK